MTSVTHQQNVPTAASATGSSAPDVSPVTGGKLGVPQKPQVNLLPAEVTHRRQVAAAQRRMVWIIIAAILVVVMAFAGAFLVRANANLNREEALATADQLLQQRREYSPVIEVKDSIATTMLARAFVLFTEVNWASYTYALAAVLPDDVVIGNLSIEAAGAAEGLVEGADQLTTNAIGVITFEAVSPTLPVASQWIDAIESLPGLADANIQSSELNAEGDQEYYDVSATIQVTLDAAANREFVDEELMDLLGLGDAAAADDAESGE